MNDLVFLFLLYVGGGVVVVRAVSKIERGRLLKIHHPHIQVYIIIILSYYSHCREVLLRGGFWALAITFNCI
jgi:hypothetical protein